ncbi:helix-turn-helix domain-containing protein [Undibacterium terreum]|uniref:HTH cro/C1-type domain-containing protein n=1 Tax=Undibacterium terreum TaxID=1224302 RepID=A0A916V1P0_9BURK|nr:helix-turn-helix transcriptional regulator [Undibacterium terreum]GGC96682.1 hypothetical protein GCM10011396_50140 [Undibacterium terreum]
MLAYNPANQVVKKRKPSELIPRVGKNVAAQRKMLGLTQDQFAGLVDVEVETISRIERGATAPSLALLEEIAVQLEIPIAELLDSGPVKRISEAEIVSNLVGKMKPKDRSFVVDFVRLFFERSR